MAPDDTTNADDDSSYRDRIERSSLLQRVIGPRIIEPVADWYQSTRETETDAAAGDARPQRSDTLASAQAAEAFFSGPDAAEPPAPREVPAPASDEAPPVAEHDPLPEAGRKAAIAAVFRSVKARIKDHNLNVVAAGIAFWALLAIPAVLTATLSIYGMVANEAEVESQIENNLDALPDDARSLIIGQLESVAGSSGGGLAVGAAVGIVLALWTSSGAVAKLIASLNQIWGVRENRGFASLRGLALALTLGAVVFVIAAAFLLAILPAILGELSIASSGRWLLNAARFPALLLVMSAGLAFVYWAGPARKASYRVITWGAGIATVLWVITSGLFSIYTASFASYNETYGSLGAVVVMLLWLYLTAFMVLLGAEIDAARAEREPVDSAVGAGAG